MISKNSFAIMRSGPTGVDDVAVKIGDPELGRVAKIIRRLRFRPDLKSPSSSNRLSHWRLRWFRTGTARARHSILDDHHLLIDHRQQ